jgi:prolipoprotein diacylglyceryltransferase
MKVGRIPIAAIALLLVALIRMIAKYYYPPQEYAYLCLILDGLLMGVVLCYILYYLNIYLFAWLKNRKEEKAV